MNQANGNKGIDGHQNTLAARGLEELRVNLLLKENSYVSDIILHRLILELKFYKLCFDMYYV